MKFFKVTLNTVGKDNKRVIFIIPPADETDENGNPAYDEDFLLSNTEYKSYIKETKAAVVSVAYILYEADNNTKLNYDELLNNENKFFKLDQNDYLIEVKKAKPNGGGKKSPTAIYIVLGIVAAAIVSMLIYGSSLKMCLPKAAIAIQSMYRWIQIAHQVKQKNSPQALRTKQARKAPPI